MLFVGPPFGPCAKNHPPSCASWAKKKAVRNGALPSVVLYGSRFVGALRGNAPWSVQVGFFCFCVGSAHQPPLSLDDEVAARLVALWGEGRGVVQGPT